MSKVISFSISDKYLEKLRTLYPSLTDNLAAKQFLTDGLDGSLGNSLDDGLDDGLDGKLKSLIESELDGILEGRLDAVVGKSLTSLSERLSRLEERLDGLLDGRLDDMELLLRMQREASIASPIPTGKPSPDEPDRPVIETVTPEVSPSPLGTDAIGTVRGDSPQLKNQLSEAVTIKGLTNAQLSEKKGIPTSTIEKWKGKIREGKEVTSLKYPDFFKQWTLNLADSLWYEVD